MQAIHRQILSTKYILQPTRRWPLQATMYWGRYTSIYITDGNRPVHCIIFRCYCRGHRLLSRVWSRVQRIQSDRPMHAARACLSRVNGIIHVAPLLWLRCFEARHTPVSRLQRWSSSASPTQTKPAVRHSITRKTTRNNTHPRNIFY